MIDLLSTQCLFTIINRLSFTQFEHDNNSNEYTINAIYTISNIQSKGGYTVIYTINTTTVQYSIDGYTVSA